MSLAFFKKAFGVKKVGDGREFDDFLKYFDKPDPVNHSRNARGFKRKSLRFMVIGYEGRKIYFDSLSYKEAPRPLPVFVVGSRQISLVDYVFGSYSLTTSKDLLYSIKVHDFSSSGQILITRFLNDLSDWRSAQTLSKRYFGNKQPCSSSAPQMPPKSEPSLHNSVVACLLVNINQLANQSPVISATKPGAVTIASNNRVATHSVTEDKQSTFAVPAAPKLVEVSPRRFYRSLFEHCAILSVIFESLVTESFTAISRITRNRCGPAGFVSESQCCDIISNAYSVFVASFLDFCTPRLQFPVWASLNNLLTVACETSSYSIDEICSMNVTSWLNVSMDPHSFPAAPGVNDRTSYDALTTLFVRGCLLPLVTRGNEHRYFLGQLITGVLILHPGWVASLLSPGSSDSTPFPLTPLHSSGCTSLPNILLNQVLSQAGCTEINLDCLSGSVFNCTILTGQSKKYLLALLYFVTYFLRFLCVTSTNEVLPDLGRADLFELEQQCRQPRLMSKARRKSGSAAAIIGDSHDSGISSQEDLTVSLHSASTGSSPTHASGMALCMPNRLTRDQCLIAQLAAQRMVCQEAAAAAASSGLRQHVSALGSSSITIRPITEAGNSHDSINPITSASYSRFTEIPLLIEKFIDDQDELCACLSLELFPGANSLCSNDQPSSSGLLHSKGMSDSSPALVIDSGPSRASSFSCAASPPSNASSVGASNPRQGDLSRSGHSLGRSSAETSHRPIDSPLPQITNHSLIGSSVSDRYSTGLILQATSESLDSFKDRLFEHLQQWLQLGPLVLRGMNLSTRKPPPINTSGLHKSFVAQQYSNPQWRASALVVNTDTRAVEIMTVRRPSIYGNEDSNEASAVRHSFSQPHYCNTRSEIPCRDNPTTKRSSPMSDFPQMKPIHPSPMVMRLLDKVVQVADRTSCAPLALRDLEGALYLIYARSRVIADLLTKMGHSVLQKTDWIADVVGCSPNDIPLLLATASSYCLPAASILHDNHSDWWIS